MFCVFGETEIATALCSGGSCILTSYMVQEILDGKKWMKRSWIEFLLCLNTQLPGDTINEYLAQLEEAGGFKCKLCIKKVT